MEKRCSKCGEIKPQEEFRPRKDRGPSSLHSQCKVCEKESWREREAKRVREKRPPVATGEKKCRSCGEVKDVSSFSPHKTSPDGRLTICRECKNRSARYCYAKNPEVLRERAKAWGKAHPGVARESQRRQYRARPWVALQKVHKRKASQLSATPSWANKEEMRLVYLKAKELTQKYGVQFHVDHVVPLKSDLVCGLHVPANLQLLEAKTNVSKSNRVWPDMPGEP